MRDTDTWSERAWNAALVRSADRAYDNFVRDKAVEPIVADWRRITGRDGPGEGARRGPCVIDRR